MIYFGLIRQEQTFHLRYK